MNTHFVRPRIKVDEQHLLPKDPEILEYVIEKYGTPEQMGPNPKLRYDSRFASADDWYECFVSQLAIEGVDWLDVGCGRDIFPSNLAGAEKIAKRVRSLVGVDPDENVFENQLLTDSFQGLIEDYDEDRSFDLLTMRMVAEHVTNAEACVEKLASLVKDGGRVIIYTPWKYAPLSIVASVVPDRFHNRFKRLIWDSEERDTFPTAYRMNTRKTLRGLFQSHRLREIAYFEVDDCSVLSRYQWLNRIEIGTAKSFSKLHLSYPEFCILACYEKQE